jgi:predicted MPP superfamily phosphohydrolase
MPVLHPPRQTRRGFLNLLRRGGLGALAVGLYTWQIEPHLVEVVERHLPIHGLPAGLAGRTLAQISDLHVGYIVDSDYLRWALRLVSSLGPDLVVITGDFMSCEATEQADQVARVLEHLRPARLGCYAILGNHDYGQGWHHEEAADRLARRVAERGIFLLRNSMQVVAGLQLAGIDDLWGPNFRPGQVMPRLDPTQPALVLCHNPDAVDRPVWSGYQGWILAGHTHGGQCKPPFLPPPRLPVQNKRYTAGEFDLGDGRMLYINRGLGYLRRVRFNVRPEITLFRLVPEAIPTG